MDQPEGMVKLLLVVGVAVTDGPELGVVQYVRLGLYVAGETHVLGAPVPVPDPYPVDSRTDVVPTASVELA